MDGRQKTYCIVCGNEKKGIGIRNDRVIEGIRWIKTKITGAKSNNKLVVCRDCYKKYSASKKRFDSRKRLYLALGLIFAVLILIAKMTVISLAFAIFMVVLLYLFAFFNYVPDLDVDSARGGGR